MGTESADLLREALHRPAVIHRPGCAEGDLFDRLTRADSFMECSCGGTSQFHAALAAGSATPDVGLPVGAVLAAALMASNYPGDSGEDVDRLIAELAKRGLRLAAIDARPGLDPQIAVEMRKEFDDLRSWVKEFDDGTGATVVRLDDVLDVLNDAALAAIPATPDVGLDVERLSKAMRRALFADYSLGAVERLAAEYARLAQDPTSETDQPA